MINNVTIEGIVKLPTFREEESNRTAQFSFILESKRGNKSISVPVCLFGKVALSAKAQGVEDGARISVVGSIDEKVWVDKDNTKTTRRNRITADKFSLA